MALKSWRSQLAKKWRRRLSVGLIVGSVAVLIDEVVKEGYLFDWTDLLNVSVTHEKLFLILLGGSFSKYCLLFTRTPQSSSLIGQ